MSFLMHVVDHVPHYLVFDTMLPFPSLLIARVSEFGVGRSEKANGKAKIGVGA